MTRDVVQNGELAGRQYEIVKAGLRDDALRQLVEPAPRRLTGGGPYGGTALAYGDAVDFKNDVVERGRTEMELRCGAVEVARGRVVGRSERSRTAPARDQCRPRPRSIRSCDLETQDRSWLRQRGKCRIWRTQPQHCAAQPSDKAQCGEFSTQGFDRD